MVVLLRKTMGYDTNAQILQPSSNLVLYVEKEFAWFEELARLSSMLNVFGKTQPFHTGWNHYQIHLSTFTDCT